jgi:ribosomal protein S8E
VNVVVLLINIIKNKLSATFVSLGVIVYSAIIVVNLSWRFADSYRSSMLMLSESNLCGTNDINPRQ